MVYKTYISKFNTIISGSKLNTGLNPISELVYGHDNIVSRALIYFDHTQVKELMDKNLMVDMKKMKHTLHITNAGSIDFTQLHHCETSSINDNKKIRATSFTLIFFLIPKPWDNGKGYDYTKNFFNADFYSKTVVDPNRLISTDGCNWFKRINGLPWDEEGVFDNDTLSVEYDKWSAGEESIIIGRQHFDIGNENIDIDITETFNKFLTGELENYGLGIAYCPLTELTDSEYENYLGLLTNHTNTFFEPYVETRYDDVVSDDRSNFVLNKNNRLYLYCTIGESLQDLDSNPIVTIKDSDDEIVLEGIEAVHQSKGIYYVELNLSNKDFETDTMLYDTWGGISYQGTKLDDVELDFVLKASSNFFNIGNSLSTTNVSFTPSTSGIKQGEQIKRGDIRKVVISAKPNYTNNTTQLVDRMTLRLYVKDGTREIDVIGWDGINKAFSENFYMIDTSMLLPQRYFVDIKIEYGMDSIIHHDVLSFDIVDDLNNRYA
jgi:hypothetical protein